MSVCTLPPAGWTCSRKSGHEGPCATRPSRPYNEYINKTINEISFRAGVFTKGEDKEPIIGEWYTSLNEDEVRNLLLDAWMDGLKYSLVMIESEKRGRDDIK